MTKKVRFEVFKRDSFTCQYCGRSAPDVTLQVDHIDPKANGGSDNILNLITSCFDCNQGKRHRLLSDDSVITKQKTQLDALQGRREQIEMMMDWQKGLQEINEESVQRLADFWAASIGAFSLTADGIHNLKKWVKRFTFDEVFQAIQIAIDFYVVYEDDQPTLESAGEAFSKIPGICNNKRKEKENPSIPHINYVRAVLCRRFDYVNKFRFMPLMNDAAAVGIDWEWVKHVAKTASTWTKFHNTVFDAVYDEQE